MNEPRIQVKIVAVQEDVDQLLAALKAEPDKATVISTGPEKDPTLLEFGLLEWAALAAIVQLVFYTGELATKIYDRLQDKADAKKTIIVSTPVARVVFKSSENLSRKEIEQVLKKLTAVTK